MIPTIVFSQSQLALLYNMPTAEQIKNFQPIQMLIAPNGCQIAPSATKTSDQLVSEGWKFCYVTTAPDRPYNLFHGIQVKRIQYGLKPRISNTIHAIMGQDLGSFVSKVTSPVTDRMYALWLKAQVVVLLSRTFYAKDMHFIGNADDTTDALLYALQIKSQYSDYMSSLIDHLTVTSTTPTNTTTAAVPFDLPKYYPFRIVDLPIPNDTSGMVYLLLSLKDRKTTYVGQTKHLSKRILQHNTMFGSKQTADSSLQPWALFAVICGFESNRQLMLQVEKAWELTRNNLTQRDGPQSPETVCKIGSHILSTNTAYQNLRFVQCGLLSSHASST